MKEEQKLSVSAIKNGTVIDHIPANNLFKVIRILGLENLEKQATFGTNLGSKKLGKKAIVKLTDKYFEDDEINRLILVAPEARLNIIKNYHVIEKKQVELPNEIIGISKCVNPKCITNHENVLPKFRVMPAKDGVSLKCQYCEKITDKDNIEFIL